MYPPSCLPFSDHSVSKPSFHLLGYFALFLPHFPHYFLYFKYYLDRWVPTPQLSPLLSLIISSRPPPSLQKILDISSRMPPLFTSDLCILDLTPPLLHSDIFLHVLFRPIPPLMSFSILTRLSRMLVFLPSYFLGVKWLGVAPSTVFFLVLCARRIQYFSLVEYPRKVFWASLLQPPHTFPPCPFFVSPPPER